MKIHISIDSTITTPEITIRAPDAESAHTLQSSILSPLVHTKLPLTQGEKEFFLPITQILFFESSDSRTFAHTATEIFTTRLRLYELEDRLPSTFIRASKSVIINTSHILSVTRNLTGPSLVQFTKSHKQINASRSYYPSLRDKLNERTLAK